jgi:hypothetical protein
MAGNYFQPYSSQPTSLSMPEVDDFGSNLGQHFANMRNMVPYYDGNEDDSSYGDREMENGMNPFAQKFDIGANMGTFQLGKGILDTGANLFGAYNNFRNFGLREDQFKFQKELGNKQFAAQQRIQENKRANANFGIDERNAFKKAYGGPDGDYLQQQHLK